MVRLTQEHITMPAACSRSTIEGQEPRYQASNFEWLQSVTDCWGEDHTEEIGLHPMTWTYSPEEENRKSKDQITQDLGGT